MLPMFDELGSFMGQWTLCQILQCLPKPQYGRQPHWTCQSRHMHPRNHSYTYTHYTPPTPVAWSTQQHMLMFTTWSVGVANTQPISERWAGPGQLIGGVARINGCLVSWWVNGTLIASGLPGDCIWALLQVLAASGGIDRWLPVMAIVGACAFIFFLHDGA